MVANLPSPDEGDTNLPPNAYVMQQIEFYRLHDTNWARKFKIRKVLHGKPN